MTTFDIAIVGAGSAGCALAGRLAARTRLRIALIEAGPDFGPRASGRWPRALLDAHHTPDGADYDWGYAQSRARVVGGCSTHNECGLVRAQPGDFDAWNVPGWTDRALAPILAEVERRLPRWRCGADELSAWQRAFLDAALAHSFPRLPDDDVSGAIGVGPVTQNIVDGVRWNASFTFLDEVRPRVTILAGVLADRLVFEGDGARGLIVLDRTGEHEICAERLVLSAGVYGSPSILLRSGVGPPAHLRELEIPVRVALPGVGANLHDHPGVGSDYVPSARGRGAARNDVRAGRFYQAQVILKPNANLHVFPYQLWETATRCSFGIFVFHLAPRSRGRMRLTARDPRATPAIDLALLTDRRQRDREALVRGLQLVHRLTCQPPLPAFIARGPRRFTSAARLRRYVEDNVADYAHSVGTCRMGGAPDAGDVVDARTRVHGLRNVFIADASVIPRIPRANTNLTCFAVGVRAADLLAAG